MNPDETFNTLYEQHLPMVQKIVSSRLTQYNTLVDDTTQEVWLKVWSAMQKPMWKAIENGKLVNWLATLAKNTSIDALRKINKRKEVELSDSIIDELAEQTAEESSDDTTALNEAVERLPLLQRFLIQQYYYDDATVKRVADQLGIPEGTVKYWLSETRKQLHKEMKQ